MAAVFLAPVTGSAVMAQNRLQIAMTAALCLASFAVGMWWMSSRSSVPAGEPEAALLIEEARAALEERRWDAAAVAINKVPEDDPLHAEALLIHGEVATRQDRWEEALDIYARVPGDGGETDVKARLAAGELRLHRGQFGAATTDFEYAHERYPEAPFTLNRLAVVLDHCGRRYEASKLLFDLVLQDAFAQKHLLLLADSLAVHEPSVEVRRSSPDAQDALVNLANGRYHLLQGKWVEAGEFLTASLRLDPELLEAWVRLGEAHWRQKNFEALRIWSLTMPAEAIRHPGYWQLCAEIAESRTDLRAAARAYWEALRLDANLPAPCYRLSRLLPELLPEHDSSLFGQRATLLQELVSVAAILTRNENHEYSLMTAANLCERLGRYWEACGWARSALLKNPRAGWAHAPTGTLLATSGFGTGAQRSRAQPCHSGGPVVLSDSGSQVAPECSRRTQRTSPDLASTGIHFRDDTTAAGIEFVYFNGPDPLTESGRMFEFTGGGAAALDFDLDGWVDLYWVQGCEWPPVSGQTKHLDQLCRNRAGQFQNVAPAAGLNEDRFGQGVAIGDFNQDGFADIYVLNVLQNRLWKNLGDGRFEDATEAAGLTASEWSTSGVLADLNADGLPDIVDVNYAQGDDVYTKICDEAGVARSCSPLTFVAADDQAWLNLGDGQFENISEPAGFTIGEGRGLGIVAFRASLAERKLNLFVANDMTANFYFRNQTAPGETPRFQEQGVMSGLAVDVNGAPQASMGIATADVDGNGLLDFCVTNFSSEANNLYLQLDPDQFSDEAAAWKIREPSYAMLGFGTQFLDADADGRPDLFVANGHVDDFTYKGIPYRMRPQFFRNVADQQFTELSADQVGGVLPARVTRPRAAEAGLEPGSPGRHCGVPSVRSGGPPDECHNDSEPRGQPATARDDQ